MVRSDALQKFFKGLLYVVGFISSVIIGTMIYLQNNG